MATITVEGGPSNWRELFLDRPGLAVTPENHDRLLAEAQAAAAAVAAGEPHPEPPSLAEAVAAAKAEEPRPAPRTPPRRLPPAPAAEAKD